MKLNLKSNLVVVALLAATMPAFAGRILHLDMEADGAGMLTESVSGAKIKMNGQHGVENVAGADGRALRLDGYSSFASGSLTSPGATRENMTFSLWAAPETFPIVRHDEPTTDKIILAGTLDEGAKKGWAFRLGSTGKYSFIAYINGWPTEIEADEILPPYEWSRIVVTVGGGKMSLYRNGKLIKNSNANGTIDDNSRNFYLGKGPETLQINGGFNLNTFNGLIDDLEVFDSLENAEDMNVLASDPADLSIPESRFSDSPLRPRFHGMPGANWTNETHGMTFSNGKYHVFFQKNANGPYMSRLHWGHISSPDLVNWTEERIALFPDQSFDIKGCWSGCVFSDDAITGGKPNIIYTGVDYAKAVIGQAAPDDDDLIGWTKKANPIINGKPGGLSDDFRDPYFFRNGNDAYIIVGSSKDGVGVTTLHKYIPAVGMWTNSAGDIFFGGTNAATAGTFWEMPNVTPMGDGKWLFTATPQATSQGVRTLYWTGSINANGRFEPDAASASPRGVELISKEGYGLLSPTIFQHDGKTIAMGIVPDKLPGSINYQLGWAHCYSLPREWSLDANGNLLQKPFEGLKSARSEGYTKSSFTLTGSEALGNVSGSQVELLGRFVKGTSPFGFKFFKNGSSEAVLKYLPGANMLTLDLTGLDRINNDGGVYNGTYSCMLPEGIANGSEVKLNLFIDSSIIDIFVNDKWATSVRVFPNGTNAKGVEVFGDSGVQVNEVSAWIVDPSKAEGAGIGNVIWSDVEDPDAPVNVYDMHGRLLKSMVSREEARQGLDPGLYIIGTKKVIIR